MQITIDRDQLEQSLQTLREKRGQAALSGRAFDNEKIAEVECQIAALDDVDAERTRIARSEASAKAQAARQERLDRIEKLERERVKAWADANAACVALREALTRIKATSAAQSQTWGTLSDVPPMLGPGDVSTTIGARIISELSELPGHRGGIGPLKFYGSSGVRTADWRKTETARMAAHLKTLEEKTNNGDEDN